MKQNQKQITKIKPTSQIPQKYWHKLFRQDYVVPCTMFELTGQQINKLIQLQTAQQLQNVINEEQKQLITSALSNSSTKALYPKINGRTPKDLSLINREIRKSSDFIQVLHTSQYILEGLHKNQSADVILRNYLPQLASGLRVYTIVIRSGFVIGISQKFCDHIQTPPTNEQLQKIFDIAQQIMAPITMITPKNHQLNSFVISLHMSPTPKITSVSPYPLSNQNQLQFSLISWSALQTHHQQILKNMHKSTAQQYEMNQGVIPLISTVTKQEDIKHYDMGQYLTGNQIDHQDKLEEWNNFMKEATTKLGNSHSKNNQNKQQQQDL